MLNLVIVQLCANAKSIPLLMNMRITCSTVTYLLLKSKTVMMRLSMRFTPCLNITPTGDDGRTPDGLIRGLNIKRLYLDVTIANPTSITYLNRGSSREELVTIKD